MRPPRPNSASRGTADQSAADSIDVPRLHAFSDALLAIHTSADAGWPGEEVIASFHRLLPGAKVSFGPPTNGLVGQIVQELEARLVFECTVDGQTHQVAIARLPPLSDIEVYMARALVRHLSAASRLASPDAMGEPASVVETRVGLPREGLAAMGLTATQCEIMEGVVRGETNGQIADRLGRSRRTIEKHMENILEKLGVETRLAAARAVLRWLESRVSGSPPR